MVFACVCTTGLWFLLNYSWKKHWHNPSYRQEPQHQALFLGARIHTKLKHDVFTPLEAETLDNQVYKIHKCWQERKSKIHKTHTTIDTYLLWTFLSPPGHSSQLSIEFCGVFHPLMLLVTSPQTLLTKLPTSHHHYWLKERDKSLAPDCPLCSSHMACSCMWAQSLSSLALCKAR